MANKSKLFCCKISNTPQYKEEMVTEITERVFQLDGYQIADQLLEGILFDIYFDNDEIIDVKINDDYCRNYFESNFNSKRWYDEVKKYAKRTLEGDEVEVPKFIKDKYFKNGINAAFITKNY